MEITKTKVDSKKHAALLRGLARWRLALEKLDVEKHDERAIYAITQEQLQNLYLCVDTDVIHMYTQPARSAGYLGLHQYNRSDTTDPDELLSATALTSGLAKFILFELECKQKTTDPRLLLPGHAEEIDRAYTITQDKAIQNLSAAQNELKELVLLANKVSSTLDADNTSTQESFADAIRSFMNRWFGVDSKTSVYPLLTALNNFSSLFNPTSNDDSEANIDSTRLLNITRFKFGNPFEKYNNYAPIIDSTSANFQKKYSAICKAENIDSNHESEIVSEIEQRSDHFQNSYKKNTKQLTAATDAYAYAWLTELNTEASKERNVEAATFLKLISGAQIPGDGNAPHENKKYAIHPLCFLYLYLDRVTKNFRFQDAQEEYSSTIKNLESALNCVLDKYYELDRGVLFINWCTRIANTESDAELEKYVDDFDDALFNDLQEAWNRVGELIRASDAEHSQDKTFFKIIQELSSNSSNFTPHLWLEKIKSGITTAFTKLTERSVLELGSLATHESVKSARHPPPLLMNDFKTEGVEKICRETVWNFTENKTKINLEVNKTEYRRVLNNVKNNPYALQILGGLAFALRGRWGAARLSFELACQAAKDNSNKTNDDPSNDQRITGGEAYYAYAITQRIVATKLVDIENAKQDLDLAKKVWDASSDVEVKASSIRYESELLSIELTRAFYYLKNPNDIGNNLENNPRSIAVNHFGKAVSLCLKVTRESNIPEHIGAYVAHAAACCIVQFYLLKRWYFGAGVIFEYPDYFRNIEVKNDYEILHTILNTIPSREDSSHGMQNNYSNLVYLNRQLVLAILGQPIESDREALKSMLENRENRVIKLVDDTRMKYFQAIFDHLQ